MKTRSLSRVFQFCASFAKDWQSRLDEGNKRKGVVASSGTLGYLCKANARRTIRNLAEFQNQLPVVNTHIAGEGGVGGHQTSEKIGGYYHSLEIPDVDIRTIPKTKVHVECRTEQCHKGVFLQLSCRMFRLNSLPS